MLFVAPLAIVGGSLWVVSQLRHGMHDLPPVGNRAIFDKPNEASRTNQANVNVGDGPMAVAPDCLLEQQCRRISEQLDRELNRQVHPPFVIAGDLPEKELAAWYKQTIRPAAAAMAHDYFDVPPDAPITVLLFRDESSYNHYAKKLFGDEGVSVYGYYKPRSRTLVMNIATGGGTLVHELTHALADFDFPTIPDWFNEGLASLHEQCRIREDCGTIEGLVNWRLPVLQKAIRSARLRSIESLIVDNDFRDHDVGLNYAQARYFCLYLQRLGLLDDYYRAFRDNQPRDPTGIETLRSMFPQQTLQDVDADFRRWAMGLAW